MSRKTRTNGTFRSEIASIRGLWVGKKAKAHGSVLGPTQANIRPKDHFEPIKAQEGQWKPKRPHLSTMGPLRPINANRGLKEHIFYRRG